MSGSGLEIRQIDQVTEKALASFFEALKQAGDEVYFHPHPLTPEEAYKRVQYTGQDLYYVLVEDEQILGYGMLRGWDEGYDIPSLGIVIHPKARGIGLGKAFMHFLHVAAHRKGATKTRLKVYPNNKVAVNLYETLGYVFQNQEAEQLVGFLDL